MPQESLKDRIARLNREARAARKMGDAAGAGRAERKVRRARSDRRDILSDFEERIPGQTRATPPVQVSGPPPRPPKKPTTSGQESSATATPQPAATSKDDPKDVTSHPQPAGDSPRDNRKLAEAEQAASTTAVPQPGSSRSNLSARTAELERLEKAGTLTADEKRELAGNRGQTDRQTAGAVLAGAGVAIAPAVLTGAVAKQVLAVIARGGQSGQAAPATAPAVLTGAVAKQVLAVIARGGQSGQAAPATLIKVSQGQIIIMASVGGTISALNVKGNKERLDAIGDWIKGKIARGESFQGQLEGLKDSTPTQAGNKLFEQATSMGGIDKPDTKALDQLKTISKPVDGVSERVGTTTKERPDTAEPLRDISAKSAIAADFEKLLNTVNDRRRKDIHKGSVERFKSQREKRKELSGVAKPQTKLQQKTRELLAERQLRNKIAEAAQTASAPTGGSLTQAERDARLLEVIKAAQKTLVATPTPPTRPTSGRKTIPAAIATFLTTLNSRVSDKDRKTPQDMWSGASDPTRQAWIDLVVPVSGKPAPDIARGGPVGDLESRTGPSTTTGESSTGPSATTTGESSTGPSATTTGESSTGPSTTTTGDTTSPGAGTSLTKPGSSTTPAKPTPAHPVRPADTVRAATPSLSRAGSGQVRPVAGGGAVVPFFPLLLPSGGTLRKGQYAKTIRWTQGWTVVTRNLFTGETTWSRNTGNPKLTPAQTLRVVEIGPKRPRRQRLDLGVVDVVIAGNRLKFVRSNDTGQKFGAKRIRSRFKLRNK